MMRTRSFVASLLALSIAACGDDPAVEVDAGGDRTDAATAPDASTPGEDGGGGGDDAAVPAEDGGTPTGDGGTSACGGARPDVSGIRGTEGLVIARDGTIYYSQTGGVGRMTPDGTQDDTWVTISGATTIWGLALDAANESLYVASPGNGRIYVVDLTAATPSATVFVMTAGQPNGMTIGPDGALYYSDFGGRRVYRVMTGVATGTRVEVTTSTINGANGLAFLADGTLLVASYGTGTIHRLTLTAGVETARDTFATGVGAPDGIAVDADGRVYVTDNGAGRLIRLEADGTGAMNLLSGVGAAASLEFGVGALDCEDIYVTSSGAMRRYEMGTAAGAAVPWH